MSGWAEQAAGEKPKVIDVPKEARKFRRKAAKSRRDVHKTEWTPKTIDDDLISLKEACWRNHYGICYFMSGDPEPCRSVCPNWICFHKEYLKMLGLKNINSKGKKKSTMPLDFHQLWLQNKYIRTIFAMMDEGQSQVRLEDSYGKVGV